MRIEIAVIFILLSACAGNEKDTSRKEPEPTKVIEEPVNPFLGTWRETEVGDSMHQQISWGFSDSTVNWQQYVHQYRFNNDTLFISGLPYHYYFISKDSLSLTSIRMNKEYLLLKDH